MDSVGIRRGQAIFFNRSRTHISVIITAMHICYSQNMEADETAQYTESFKSGTCSGATPATLTRIAIAVHSLLEPMFFLKRVLCSTTVNLEQDYAFQAGVRAVGPLHPSMANASAM